MYLSLVETTKVEEADEVYECSTSLDEGGFGDI
jgi:hypothetical protein